VVKLLRIAFTIALNKATHKQNHYIYIGGIYSLRKLIFLMSFYVDL